jgi:hypothetical protein
VHDAVQTSFAIDPASLAVTPAELEDFILFLPDGATADMVFNGGASLHRSTFPLFFKRWTHLARADAAVLPTPIELDLWGILAHAWDQSTTQHNSEQFMLG